MSLSQDPFNSALDSVTKFREFDITIVRGPINPLENTQEFVSTYKAIQVVHPSEPVVIPNRASFFDFATISPFEEQFSFSHEPYYKEIRNFIVAIYRIFSTRYLPYTLCRRSIKAPAHLTLKIWKFLQKYGLINYQINQKTRPCSIIPQFDRWPFDRWPQLIYTVNDKLFANDQYYKRIHPVARNIQPTNEYQQQNVCMYMQSPYVSPDKTPNGAEVPGLMSFGNWTKQEIEALINAFKPDQRQQPQIQRQQPQLAQSLQLLQQNPQNLQNLQNLQNISNFQNLQNFSIQKIPNIQNIQNLQNFQNLQNQQNQSLQQNRFLGPDTWQQVSQKVKTKTPEECAAMIAMMPIPFDAINLGSKNIKNEDGTVRPEYTTADHLLREIALSHNKSMRIVHRAVEGVGNEKAQRIMKDQLIDLPNDSNEAASILAMNKIAKNAERMKLMHKARILECLKKTVDILRIDIQNKRKLINEAKADSNISRVSESEMTSSDEKMWSEQPNDNDNE